jgi:two-component system, OmpR family, sensor histidine kinase KdpD
MPRPFDTIAQWTTRAGAQPDGWREIFWSLVLVAVVAAMLEVLRQFLDLPPVATTFLVPVLIAAIRWGTRAAVVATIAGALCSTFLFYKPLYSFDLGHKDPARILSLVLFLILALVAGYLSAAVRREAAIARKREVEIRDLYAFSRRLAGANAASDIYEAIHQHLSSLVGRRVALFGPAKPASAPAAHFGDAEMPMQIRAAVIAVTAGKVDPATAAIIDDGSGNLWLIRAVSPKSLDFGVIAVDLGPRTQETEEDIRIRVDAILADATTTLEHLGLAQAISEARMRAETERFREALIGSVSHELRTPLASILGATTVLCNAPAVRREQRLSALASVVREEAERLNDDIQNLLDATRISSKGLQPKFEWAEPADIVNTALERRRNRLNGRPIEVELADELPLVYVDPVLIEQALGQVLDNAAKYSHANAPIRLAGRRENGEVVLSVSDKGAGLTADEHARLGERFFRGDRQISATAGSGLGLWIANAFLAANGGSFEAMSAGEGRGTTIAIHLPIPAGHGPTASLDHD